MYRLQCKRRVAKPTKPEKGLDEMEINYATEQPTVLVYWEYHWS